MTEIFESVQFWDIRKKAREEKLDDMEIGHALASTADPTPHVPKTTTTSKCLFPAQLAQATDVQDVVPNQDGIPVFEEPAEKQTGDCTSESLTSGENSAVAWHPEAVLKPTLGTFPTSAEAVVVANSGPGAQSYQNSLKRHLPQSSPSEQATKLARCGA